MAQTIQHVEEAQRIVKAWICDNVKDQQQAADAKLFIVWSSKVLQNYKCTIFTSLPASPYFELTYNGDKKEWYLDVYQKIENATFRYVPGEEYDKLYRFQDN